MNDEPIMVLVETPRDDEAPIPVSGWVVVKWYLWMLAGLCFASFMAGVLS